MAYFTVISHKSTKNHLKGLLWEGWEKGPEDGTSVFLQGYENRGPDNLKKKAYYSAMTPDIYHDNYAYKVNRFFDQLLSADNAETPLMDQYLNLYPELYWQLHLGVEADDIPENIKEIATAFNKVFAILEPVNTTDKEIDKTDQLKQAREFKDNYLYVRDHHQELKDFITLNLEKLENNPQAYSDTFCYHWMLNGEGVFDKKDIIFECFHNFLALSQWGNTIYNIINLLRDDFCPDEYNYELSVKVKNHFEELMAGDYDAPSSECSPFSKLDTFTMELFRVIMPNPSSFSSVELGGNYSTKHVNVLNFHIHHSIGNSPLHWPDAEQKVIEKDGKEFKVWIAPFDPTRYDSVPDSSKVDEAGLKSAAALAACPFEHSQLETTDGRIIENNIYGTTSSRNTDGDVCPVVETAGYSSFCFGYRRCPGELLTIDIIKTFLVQIIDKKLGFKKLPLSNPQEVPIAVGTFVTDDIGFFFKAEQLLR